MRIMRQTVGVVSGAALLLAVTSSDALASVQVYRASLICEGGGHGVAQIRTLSKRGDGISEPFFRVQANLSHLPDLPVTSCQVTLACQDPPEVSFDCADAVHATSMKFNSGDIFLGVLPVPCHGPVVRATIEYAGAARSCISGF